MPHVRHMGEQVGRVERADLHAAHREGAPIPAQPPQQERGERGLAAAGLAHHGHEAARRNVQAHAIRHFALPVVGEVQVACAHVAARGERLPARRGLRQAQQPEDLLARGHAVHRHVEERPQLAHGNEVVRRQQDDGEAPSQVNRAGSHLRERHRHAGGRPAIRHEVHDRDGVELHREHAHRDAPELLGLLVHLRLLELVGLVDLERGEALEVLKERVSELGVLAPVAAEQPLCPGLHRCDGDRDERYAHEQHHGRRNAHEGEGHEERERREHGVEELRQVRAEVGLELVASLNDHLHDLGGAHVLAIARPQAQELLVDAVAQRALDLAAGEKPHARGAHGGKAAHDGRAGHAGGEKNEVLLARRARPERGERPADDEHHAHVGHKRRPLEGHARAHVPHAPRHDADEPSVDHHVSSPLTSDGLLC